MSIILSRISYWFLILELCAEKLVVGGGVGWSYDWQRQARRAFFIGGGGVRPDERALKQRTRWTGVFSGFTGVSHFTCDLRWRRKVNCEYASCAQFHSLNELIVHCQIYGGSYKCNVECWGDVDIAREKKTWHWKTRDWKCGNKNMAIVEWLN